MISGGNGEGVPPVPIPNTEVKPPHADGTWLETARESRTLPDSINGVEDLGRDSRLTMRSMSEQGSPESEAVQLSGMRNIPRALEEEEKED